MCVYRRQTDRHKKKTYVSERERERKRERQTDRQTDRQTARKRVTAQRCYVFVFVCKRECECVYIRVHLAMAS